MRFYSIDVVKKVRRERQKGASIENLERALGVPSSTISRWVRDIPSRNRAFQDARRTEKVHKETFHRLISGLRADKEQAKIFSGLLYWCEGSKYPASNFVAFSNSDWVLVKTFLDLLRCGFGIDEGKIRIHLQLHTTHNQSKVFKFWSKLLRVPENKFYRPTVTAPTHKMKRRGYMGTCTVKYFNVKLLLQLTGLFESFGKRSWRRG